MTRTGRIVIACLVGAAVIGALAYVFATIVMKPKFHQLLINNGKIGAGSTFTNGSTLSLEYVGSRIRKVDWSFSVDNGVTFSVIAAGSTTKAIQWVIPSNVYTVNCIIRVADTAKPTKVYLNSARFFVTPFIHMTLGLKRNETIVIPNQFQITYDTNSNLFKNSNLVLKVSADGINFSEPADPYSAVAGSSYLLWKLSSTLNQDKVFLRVETNDLVEQGYPAELSAVTPFQLEFTTNGNSSNNSVGDVFAGFSVFSDPSLTSILKTSAIDDGRSWVMNNETLYMQFTLADGADPLELKDLSFQYQLDESDWQTMEDVIVKSSITHEYEWTIPEDTPVSTIMNLRVSQTNTETTPRPSRMIAGLKLSAKLHATVPSARYYNESSPPTVTLQVQVYSSFAFGNPYGLSWYIIYVYNDSSLPSFLSVGNGTLSFNIPNVPQKKDGIPLQAIQLIFGKQSSPHAPFDPRSILSEVMPVPQNG